MVLTRPKGAFSSMLDHRNLECQPSDPKSWSVHPFPKKHKCWKSGENKSNTFQDIALTTFWDAQTDSQTDRFTTARKHNVFFHYVGGGIKDKLNRTSTRWKSNKFNRHLFQVLFCSCLWMTWQCQPMVVLVASGLESDCSVVMKSPINIIPICTQLQEESYYHRKSHTFSIC